MDTRFNGVRCKDGRMGLVHLCPCGEVAAAAAAPEHFTQPIHDAVSTAAQPTHAGRTLLKLADDDQARPEDFLWLRMVGEFGRAPRSTDFAGFRRFPYHRKTF